MTPDPRLVALVKCVRCEVPDWTPPPLPDGDASAALDRIAVDRLRGVMTFAPVWPDEYRDQVVAAIEGANAATEGGGDRQAARHDALAWLDGWRDAAWDAADAARSAYAARSAAWSAAALNAAAAAADAAADAARAVDADAARSAAWQREANRIAAALTTTEAT